jgi:uncharacterized protein YndB with AHSA1/START domain
MSLPRRATRNGTRGYAHLVELDVPPARAWRALIDPALIKVWSGLEAQVDARQGGLYRIGAAQAGAREAHIDIFDPNRRLRLIYLNGRGWPPADSAVVDDFILDQRKGDAKTSLRLLGSGVPDSQDWDPHYARLRMGWERFMARIKVTLESPPKPKKAPPPDEPKDPPLRYLDY